MTFGPGDAFVIPFSIGWCAFAIFWEVGVVSDRAGPFFAFFGLPFVAIGCYMVFGRFIAKARLKRRTAYGLTSARALVAVGTASLVDSPVANVPTSLRRSRDGRHVSVVFGDPGPRRWNGVYPNSGLDAFTRAPAVVGFFDVADGDNLLATLARVQASYPR